MSKFFSEKRLLFFLLFGFIAMFFLLAIFSEATFDAGDGIRHYLISRYSWNHPYLLLDSWGKPFFTLISSPFSQFGFLGITFFNIVCGATSAFLVFKIAKKLNYNYPLLAIPFLFFAPIYFPTMNSGLTEPFFGLVLISSIFLMIDKKYFVASFLVSFLPYIRSEGVLILPLFVIILVYNRSIWSAFLLSFGTLLYSVIGFFYFDDFFWIKTQNPYNGANREFYGHGELFSFINDYNLILGSALGLLFIIGCSAIIYRSFFKSIILRKKEFFSSLINEENILILGSFVLYFAAHSIMWWKGLANSMGLIRVLAAVIPCSAIICLRGFNSIVTLFFKRNNILKISFTILILFFVIRSPFKNDYFPYKLSKEQAVINDVGNWVKSESLTKNKIYYLYPYLALVLNIDSFDEKKVAELWGLYPSIKKYGIGVVPDSTIVIWDAHFGPNECHIPLDTLMYDPNFVLLKTFYPKERFNTLGGYPFEVCVFMKTNTPKKKEKISMEELSFDPLNSEKNTYILSKEIEYGTTLKKNISELPPQTKSIVFSGQMIDPEKNSKNALVVLIVDDVSGKNLFWEGKPLIADSTNEKKVDVSFELNVESFQPTNIFKTYIWNKDKKYFYLFDCKISYFGKK